MFRIGWTVLWLAVWTGFHVGFIAERMDPYYSTRYDGMAILFHLVLVVVPWALWWWTRPERRLRRAANAALQVIRLEGLRLGPAFDELVAAAERFWQTTGDPALRQYVVADRELGRSRLRSLLGGAGSHSIQGVRDMSLVDGARAVTALERLGLHMIERRVVELDRATLQGRIEQLQEHATRSLAAHDEANRVPELGA